VADTETPFQQELGQEDLADPRESQAVHREHVDGALDVVAVLDGTDRDVAVARGSGACSLHDDAHDSIDVVVLHDHFDFELVDVLL